MRRAGWNAGLVRENAVSYDRSSMEAYSLVGVESEVK